MTINNEQINVYKNSKTLPADKICLDKMKLVYNITGNPIVFYFIHKVNQFFKQPFPGSDTNTFCAVKLVSELSLLNLKPRKQK